MKTRLILVVLLALLTILTLAACDDGSEPPATPPAAPPTEQNPPAEPPDESLPEITGVTLADAAFTYDGTAKTIEVQGLPAGAQVSYTGATQTNAGTYPVTAVVTCEGYQTLTLNATLTINKATITGISANTTQSVTVNGASHKPAYTGTAPAGVSVKFMLNGAESAGVSAIGTYNFQIVFSGDNYETLTLPVTFRVKRDLSGLATSVIQAFGSVPQPWSLLPDSFAPQYHTVTSAPDFSNFTLISAIPTNGIGKQMNVAYGLLNKTDVALGYVNTVMGSMNIIKSLYTTFLDSAPEDYTVYTDTVGGFTFTIELGEDTYVLRATVGTVLVELYSNTADESYGATVQLNATTVLKYTVSGTDLLVAMDVLDTMATQLQFTKDGDGNTVGMLYEYLVVGDRQLTATSAMIEVGEDYTVVIGTKGDFIPTSVSRNCEIYDNATGKLVGTEVREDMSNNADGSKIYNTYWFPLCSLEGVTSIKRSTEANLPNPDTFWINGCITDKLHSKIVGNLTFKGASRRFDIEIKTMYFYVYNSQTGEYESVSYEIPLLFVQEEYIDQLEDDFADKNKTALNNGSVNLNVSSADLAAIAHGYTDLLPIYDQAKDAVTYETITNYCKGIQ